MQYCVPRTGELNVKWRRKAVRVAKCPIAFTWRQRAWLSVWIPRIKSHRGTCVWTAWALLLHYLGRLGLPPSRSNTRSLLSHRASTIATLFCLSRRRRSWTCCSMFKMLQHVWSQGPENTSVVCRLTHDDLHWLVMPKFHYIYLAQNLLKTRSPKCFEQKKSRGPGLRHVLSRKKSGTWSPTKKVANVSLPKFHYIYLARNLLKTRSPTCFEQKKVGAWSPTR